MIPLPDTTQSTGQVAQGAFNPLLAGGANPALSGGGVPLAAPAPTAPAATPTDSAPNSPLVQNIAQNTLTANKLSPGNWSQNVVGGVMSALAGFGVQGQAPIGAGVFSGIGKAVEQRQAMAAQKQKMSLEQRKEQREELGQDRDYQLKLAENARQQTKDVRDMSEHDMRMKNMTQENSIHQFELTKMESDFRQGQMDREESLKRIGAKPLQVSGQESPTFKDLGEAEKYATDNKLFDGAQNGYRARIVFGADNAYHLFEVPDEGVKQYTLKDPSGKNVNITTDALGALNYSEKVSQMRHTNAEAEELSAKAAMERLQAGTGTDTDRAVAISGSYTKMQNDPAFQALPKNPDTGRVDDQSPEFDKYLKTSDAGKEYSAAKGSGNLGYNTSTGEAYIASLSPNVGGTVRAIGEGREGFDALPKGKEKSAYVNYLNRAYPGFDETEQKSYQTARTQYTTGAQSVKVNAGMTAFNHLYELQQLNTPQSRIVGTPDYVAYQNKLGTVTDELGNFYGNSTIPGLEELNSSLGNATFRNKAIVTQAASMADKMRSYQATWDESIPKYLQKRGLHPAMPGTQADSLAHRDALIHGTAPAKPGAPPPTGVKLDLSKSVPVAKQGQN